MDVGVLADAVDLAGAREPFALATVVWRRAPSSGHLGSKAVIRPDGTVQGWLGGACAQPTVVRQAQQAMADGQPRLLFLGRPDELDQRSDDGLITVPMACESEGALEVYLEPILPCPQVVTIGRSPAVFALASLARALDWDVAVVDDGGSAAVHPYPDLVRTSLDLSGLGIGTASAVVVATQGHYDDLALEAALATDAGYIGLVAAEKRATATLELLRARDIADEQLCRVTAPAGLDLGPVDNAEIAVAVLAELVARRAAGQLTGAPAAPEGCDALDPVCGMTVAVDDAKYHLQHEGAHYYFCAPGCLAAFRADPAAFRHRTQPT
ncbi:MAG TPA: XdhC family protein [Acidimicrobiales bacterium]